MSKKGIEFLESWLAEHITEGLKQAVDGDGASLSVELAERLIADAEKAGLFSLLNYNLKVSTLM